MKDVFKVVGGVCLGALIVGASKIDPGWIFMIVPTAVSFGIAVFLEGS